MICSSHINESGSNLFNLQVEKAIERADFDPIACIDSIRSKVPAQITSREEQQERLKFLRSSLFDENLAQHAFERVLQGNELQPIAYLERGVIASLAIARIQIRSSTGLFAGWGTGFLISPRVLITNNHVLPTVASARASSAHFSYETDLSDSPIGPVAFPLLPEELFYTSRELDFTVVAVGKHSVEGTVPLSSFGFLPLLETTGKAFEGEWLTIVQHPAGERKQLCVRENRLIKRTENTLWYSTDTLAGASGSPVFNNDWFVVALHHSGIPAERNGIWQTLDGRDFDPVTMDETQVKWIANEGIRASRIARALREVLPTHPLLQPLFLATPGSARITKHPERYSLIPADNSEHALMNPSIVTVPIELKLQLQHGGDVAVASASTAEASSTKEKKVIRQRTAKFDAPFDFKYASRQGFDTEFLGNGALRVLLPKLSKSLEAAAAPLIEVQGTNRYVLNYHNFSVVMHAERRLAIYSAANVRFDQRFDMNRPTDVWRRDERILSKHQIENFYYAANQFDRGHLTRREDLEFGSNPKEALQSAADTCHWTNCTPQHARFNQNKEIWQGIERHVLESGILDGNLHAQVITGPVLDEGDPKYKDIQYPLQYWKVVVAVGENGKLFATAYIASQEEVIAQYGIESMDVFGPYKTFQVRITEVQRLTGLEFRFGHDDGQLLETLDSLKEVKPHRRSRRRTASESALACTGAEYYELEDLDDIVF